ncbi:hypothetical protein ACG02S_01160 [Roseateles sp. DC23W]|uniref:Uncharacterized protein n=1 Tax=Pelomonas dachongensis TaxID=3299029 RepID=A0ABW7EGB4_9BURK
MTIKQQLIDATGARAGPTGAGVRDDHVRSHRHAFGQGEHGSDLAKNAIRAAFMGGAVVLQGSNTWCRWPVGDSDRPQPVGCGWGHWHVWRPVSPRRSADWLSI